MIDIFLGITAILAMYIGVGIIVYDFILMEMLFLLKIYSPLWRPFLFMFWPLTLVVVLVVGVVRIFVDWIEECKEYYSKDMED